jgi:hypothetical protein
MQDRAKDGASTTKDGGGFGAWVKRHWLLSAAVGALVTSSVAFLVNRFGPVIIEGLSGDPPLRFTVAVDPDAYTAGHAFALQGEPPTGDLPEVPSCQEVRRWAMRYGAIDGGRTHLKITVEGLSSSPVLIESMHARVESREEPIDETLVSCLVEGEIGIIGIGFNLDEQPSVARTLLENGGLGEPYFAGSNISVAEGEVLALAVTAFAEHCSCKGRIDVNAVVEGERRTFTLDDNGRPFQTTAIVTLPEHRLALYGGEWAKCEGPVICFQGEDPSPITGRYLKVLKKQQTVPVLPDS